MIYTACLKYDRELSMLKYNYKLINPIFARALKWKYLQKGVKSVNSKMYTHGYM